MAAAGRIADDPRPAHRSSHTLLRSIFGKTLRDSRTAMLLVGGVLCVLVVAGGMTMSTTYGTLEARADLAALSANLPETMRGLYGDPVRVNTLGGFISWHYGAYFVLLMGLWSIVALSSTLAGENRRGSLDFTLAAPIPRWRVALEKIVGHVTGLALVAAVVGVVAWLTGILGKTFPSDEIAPSAAAGLSVGLVVKSLFGGALAFSLASVVSRGAAAGIAGAVLVAGYVVQGYRDIVPALDLVAPLSPFSWMAGHVPLAGETDWPAVAATSAVTLGLLALGVVVFVRRDVGVARGFAIPGLSSVFAGVRGPTSRTLSELLPAAVAWSIGLALYGLVMAGSARAFGDMLGASPGLAAAVRQMVPGIDLTTTAGFLQFAFTELGFVLVGLAATTLVAIVASDETSGRLELQLAAWLSRTRWSISSAAAVWLALALVTMILAFAIGLGVALGGADPTPPFSGTFVLGVYAVALAGIGTAVIGVLRASLAAPLVLGFVVVTFLADVLGPILRLPDLVEQLALTSHLGRTMIGDWDWPGVALCLVIAAGGLAIDVWGMRRRDLAD